MLSVLEASKIVDKSLDGSTGTNKKISGNCQIPATDDLSAVKYWLAEYQHKATTFRAYRKEAERLLLWCLLERKKPLCSLDRIDFASYFEFLSNPQPSSIWCAPKGSRARSRGQNSWRPFVGPLSNSAKNTAFTIINSLMSYLVAASYLEANPLVLMRNKSNTSRKIDQMSLDLQERIISPEEWQIMLETLEEMPAESGNELDEKVRLRFLVTILLLLGLRIDELASHKWNSFRNINGAWWFFVIGKGDKPGKIPVNDSLLSSLQHFRKHIGLHTDPTPEENFPIIPSWRHGNGLGTRQMNKLIKNLAIAAAEKFSSSPNQAEKIRRFSPHWLRHLSASMQDRAGISFKHIKANHRHAHDDTTRRYVHAIDQERHDDMQKLTMG